MQWSTQWCMLCSRSMCGSIMGMNHFWKRRMALLCQSHVDNTKMNILYTNATDKGVDIMRRPQHDASVVTLSPAVSSILSSQKSIHQRTKALVAKKDFDGLSVFLEGHVSSMSTSNLISVLYLCGKFNHSLSDQQIDALVDALESRDDPFNIIDASNGCYCLQYFKNEDCRAIKFVNILVMKIQASTEAFNSQAVGNSVYGLKNLSAKTKAIRTLLLVLRDRIKACRQEIHPAHLASALYGLRRMKSDSSEVRSLVDALTQKVAGCSGVFLGPEVGNSLYGLQNMTSRQKEVLKLVSLLSPKINANREELTAQHISSALYGLRGLCSEHEEIKQLLRILCRKIGGSTCVFDAQAVCNSLHGLRNMSNEHEEVRQLLLVLTRKVQTCSEEMNPHQLCSAISGLWSMRSRPDECVLSTLLEFIIGKWESRQHHGDFTLRGLHGAVYGLRLMDSRNKFVIKLLSLLEVELMKLNDVQSAVESSTLSRSQSTTNLLLSIIRRKMSAES